MNAMSIVGGNYRYRMRSDGEWRIVKTQTLSSTTANEDLFYKKKKYYQFITSLLLEEPLCIAWLTSVHDRLAEAGGRAPTARLVLGLAGQGATRPARQSSPVSLPSAATSAEGFSGGKEGWCVEGVYSPACRTRFSRGVRRQGHYQLWHHQLCHLQLGHIPSLCVCHTRNSRVNGCLKVELAST